MPELKHNFTAGKMNKDVDERLVPNGEYRNADNVQVSTSEGSDLGSIQNLLGNYKLPENIQNNSSYVCVGAIADEKDDSLYWFIAALNNWTPSYAFVSNPNPLPLAPSVNPGNHTKYNSKDLTAWFKPEILSDKILKYSKNTTINNEVVTVVNDIKKVAVNIIATNKALIKPQYYLDYSSIQTLQVGMQLESIQILDNNGAITSTFEYSNDGPNIINIDFVTGGIMLSTSSAPSSIDSITPLGFGLPNTGRIISFIFNSNNVGVLNFDATRNNITGINIIDNMLFWTDNVNEPKKINISDCILGTQLDTYTRLINSERNINFSDNIPLTLEHVTVIRKSPTKAPTLELKTDRDYSKINDTPAEHYTGVVTIGFGSNLNILQEDDILSSTGASPTPVNFSNSAVGDVIELRIDEDIDGNADFELLWGNTTITTAGVYNSGAIVVLKEFDEDGDSPSLPITDFTIKLKVNSLIDSASPGQFISSSSDPIVISAEVISISGFPPGVIEGEVTRKYAIDLFEDDENLFEFKFPRFATRYKYKDGQYSSFSPFTPVAFVPGSFDYHPKKGYNIGMTNRLTEVKIKNFRLNDIPLDVEEIDLLYKEEGSPNIYLLDSINNNQASFNEDNWNLNEYTVTDETINATIPSNQILRPFDNVPKTALAQEVTGSRIVYGNYTQGFDLIVKEGGKLKPYSPEFKSILLENSATLGFAENQTSAVKSIKSLREYQVGVVFLDEYGRETPVISNPSGTFKVAKDRCGTSNRLKIGFTGKKPEDMKFFQFYIKETAGEYYNMAMSRYYDAKDGNVWLSFPSTDRNKIDIDTFLILKKTAYIDQPVLDRARYKVIAIENEAPDYIKTKIESIVSAKHTSNSAGSSNALFDTTGDLSIDTSPIVGSSNFKVNYKKFKSTAGSDLVETAKKGDLYVSFDNTTLPGTSDRYKVVSITTDLDKTLNATGAQLVGADAASYYFKLEKALGDDVSFIHNNAPLASNEEILTLTSINIFLYKIENAPQFDGRFFVKIYKDATFDQYVVQTTQDSSDYRTVRSIDVYSMLDPSIHEFTHSSKATGHGFDLRSHQLITNTTISLSRNAYSYQFGRYACYFRKYNFGNDNPSKIIKFENVISTSLQPGNTSGSTGYNIQQCRYKFNTHRFNRHDALKFGTESNGYSGLAFGGVFSGQTSFYSGPGNLGHWYPKCDNGYNLQAENRAWLDEYWCYTGVSMSGTDGGTSSSSPLYRNNIGVTELKASAYVSGEGSGGVGGSGYSGPVIGDFPTFGADTGVDIDNGSALFPTALSGNSNLRRKEEVWFIDYGQYSGRINTKNDHNWTSVLPGTASGSGIYGNSANDAQEREFNMHLTLGPIVHPDKKYPNSALPFNSSYINYGGGYSGLFDSGIKAKDVWSIGDEESGNPYYTDEVTQNLMGSFKIGTAWRWKEDPTNNVFTMNDVRHQRRMRYHASSNYRDIIGYAGPISSSGASEQNSIAFQGAHLSPNFNKTWKLTNIHTNEMNWVPAAGPTTGISNNVGPIQGGLACEVTTVSSGQVANNTLDIDEYHIVVTKASFEGATSSSGVSMNITPGLIITNHDATPLGGYDFYNGTVIVNPYLAIRKVEGRADGDYNLYLTGYLEALDKTHCFDPGASKTINIAQATMNGYSENSAVRISINKSATGNGAYTSSAGGFVSTTPVEHLLYPVGYTLEFVEGFDSTEILPENPAIWETEPKDTTDLDIYYAASDLLPLFLNSESLRSLLQLDQDDRNINMGTETTCIILQDQAWFGDQNVPPLTLTLASIPPGTAIIAIENDAIWVDHIFDAALVPYFAPNANQPEYISSDYRKINIFLPDGSIVTMVVDYLIPNSAGELTGLRLRPNAYDADYTLNWHNCYSFLNGVESNRIRDNFNLPFISNGVQVSTTVETEAYKEEHRKYGLIFSGLYNSISNVNNLNQFIAAEKITKDINPNYGSIQKLHTRDSDLVALCEDKILKILANKDAVFNADGNPQLTANINVLGQTIPFVGEYGISKNPESFASQSYRAYFTDKQRGAVMRLSKDGLTPISNHGMKDWFRDHLQLGDKLIGSYDDKKEEYNIAIKERNIDDSGGSLDTEIFRGQYVVSFKEDVKGWVSFKSFVEMETGLSMANDYYTFYLGDIWLHHSSLGQQMYNNFYDRFSPSSVTVLFNEEPGVVKSFKSLNYEGTQARITRPRDANGQLVDDGQYYNFEDLDGWFLSNMFTDMQTGGAVEFIKKEGKWFNYIKGSCGLKIENNSNVLGFNEDAFNYQGIGKIKSNSFRLPGTTVPTGQGS